MLWDPPCFRFCLSDRADEPSTHRSEHQKWKHKGLEPHLSEMSMHTEHGNGTLHCHCHGGGCGGGGGLGGGGGAWGGGAGGGGAGGSGAGGLWWWGWWWGCWLEYRFGTPLLPVWLVTLAG